MSGFDLVQHAREFLPDLRVLLTTGYAAETDEMIANIKEPILKKPYKKQQLAAGPAQRSGARCHDGRCQVQLLLRIFWKR